MLFAWLSVAFSHFPHYSQWIGPFWYWFQVGGFVHSRTQWSLPTDSPVRLGVSPATTTPIGFYSQRFWGIISLCWKHGLCCLSCSPVVPSSLSTHKCRAAQSASHCLAVHSLHPNSLSPPLLPVLMNVSSLTPWLSDFHTGHFYGRSVFFLNWLLSFVWLCKEAKHMYLCLHLGWKPAFLKVHHWK